MHAPCWRVFRRLPRHWGELSNKLPLAVTVWLTPLLNVTFDCLVQAVGASHAISASGVWAVGATGFDDQYEIAVPTVGIRYSVCPFVFVV